MRDALIVLLLGVFVMWGLVQLALPNPDSVVRGTLKRSWGALPILPYVPRHATGENVWDLRERLGAGEWIDVQRHAA